MDDQHLDLETPSLGKSEYIFILGLAFLQAMVLYLLNLGIEKNWAWLSSIHAYAPLFTLVLTVPIILMLTIKRLSNPKFWRVILGLAIVFGFVASCAAYLASTSVYLPADPVLTPFAVVMAASAFVITPFIQTYLLPDSERNQKVANWPWAMGVANYVRLFEDAWKNALTLLLMLVFLGLGWLVLHLWGALFELVGVDFFAELFTTKPVAYGLSGLLVGLGLLIGRSQDKPIQMSRKLVFALFTGVLPVFSLIILMFLITLPFGGFGDLWSPNPLEQRHVSVAWLLSLMIGGQLLFFNAVFQHGTTVLPYVKPLRWLIRAAMAVLPLFAVIAVASVVVRVSEYGWTPSRYWALFAVLILFLLSLGYSISAWRKNADGFTLIPIVNVSVALVALALGVISHLPMVNPYSLSANSQYKELQQDLSAIDPDSVEWLRFETGAAGVNALRKLLVQSEVQKNDNARLLITTMLARTYRYSWQSNQQVDEENALAEFFAEVHYPEGQLVMPESLQNTIREDIYSGAPCDGETTHCYGSTLSFSNVPSAYLFCTKNQWASRVDCYVTVQSEVGEWRRIGNFANDASDDFIRALENGEIQYRAPCWPALEISDTIQLIYDTSCY